jgi:hypothetical protein
MNKLTILLLAIMLIVSISARGGRKDRGDKQGPPQRGERQNPPEDASEGGEEPEDKEPPTLEEVLADHPAALAYAQCFSTCLTTKADLTSDEATHASLRHLKYLLKNADAETTDNCGCASLLDAARTEAEDTSGDGASGDDASGDDASGDDASGDDASGDDASGDDASGEDNTADVIGGDSP